jgi:hypothetical protein
MPADTPLLDDPNSVICTSSCLSELAGFFSHLRERVLQAAILEAARRVEDGHRVVLEKSDFLAVGPEILSDVTSSFEREFSDHASSTVRRAS